MKNNADKDLIIACEIVEDDEEIKQMMQIWDCASTDGLDMFEEDELPWDMPAG